MVDLETLGTGPNAPIIQIGAVAFDLEQGTVAMSHLNVDIYPHEDTRADFETVQWWMNQSAEARDSVFNTEERETEKNGVLYLTDYIETFCKEDFTIWAMPPIFDVAKLEAAYSRNSLTVPWKYNSSRCLRTLADLAGAGREDRILPSIPHVAGLDAKAQAETAIKFHGMLKG
tara:strand:- start:227 stop:745 length:519 start_codon:yes stop_codon:yes gene_type:complete